MKIKYALIIQLCLLLVACGGTGGDDLDKFMTDSANEMHARIDPLPEVKPYIPFEYNADGALNNPFKARKPQASGAANKLQPNLNRPREALEAFPLESLKFVGSISKAKLKYALIKTPDGNVQQAKIGNYLGQNFGIVTDIGESGVKVKEVVQDDVTGDWTERSASIDLQE